MVHENQKLTCKTRVDARCICMPDGKKGVYHRVAVSVQQVHIQGHWDARLAFSNVLTKQDVVQIVWTFCQLS